MKIWIAIFGVKARKADSGTMRMKRSLLVKVGEALAPDAFQLVLDSESDTKGRGHNSHTPRYPYRKENHTHQCIFFYIISVSYRICLFFILIQCMHSSNLFTLWYFVEKFKHMLCFLSTFESLKIMNVNESVKSAILQDTLILFISVLEPCS